MEKPSVCGERRGDTGIQAKGNVIHVERLKERASRMISEVNERGTSHKSVAKTKSTR